MSDPLSPSQMRRWVVENISELSVEDTREVLEYALSELPGKKFIQVASGTCLSLNGVSDEVIKGIHDLIQSKLQFFDPTDFKDDD